MLERVVIVTGESSGELYGALLARELKRRHPDLSILGVGGRRMEEAGVELIAGITGAFGLIEALSTLRRLRVAFRKVVALLASVPVDVVVLIDFPDFNLKVAHHAHRAGIKVLYYVSPQVWAWRRGRIKTIARLCDRVAALLPFEPELYQAEGIPCEFVGHPVVEELRQIPADLEAFRSRVLSLDPSRPLLAILPGSRHSELDRHLPVLLDALELIEAIYPSFEYCIPLAPDIDRRRYERYFKALEKRGVRFVDGHAPEVLALSDVAVIASGTAAFQASLIGVPAVVIYRLSWLTYSLARMLLKVKYINLANLIFDEPVVTELIQGDATPERIAREVVALYESKDRRNMMAGYFARLKELYADKYPTARVADLIEEMAGGEVLYG